MTSAVDADGLVCWPHGTRFGFNRWRAFACRYPNEERPDCCVWCREAFSKYEAAYRALLRSRRESPEVWANVKVRQARELQAGDVIVPVGDVVQSVGEPDAKHRVKVRMLRPPRKGCEHLPHTEIDFTFTHRTHLLTTRHD